LDLLRRSLRRHYDVVTADDPAKALEILRTTPADNPFALVLSDYRMPGMNGAELLAESARAQPDARRVIITGYADTDNLIQSINGGRIHYLITKPWKHKELHQVLDQLIRGYRLERENRRLMANLRGVNDELRSREKQLARNLDEQEHDLISATRELDRVGRELEVLSYKDTLTGLYNHRAFQERLSEELARARRHGEHLALLCADIDNFAALNRELGYQIGDEILRRVADIICATDSTSRVRASDIVARYGGEEFAVLLPSTSKDGGMTKADRLRAAVAAAGMPGGHPVTISLGLATFPDDATTPEELVRCAEAALEAAKRGGRNLVHRYSDGGLESTDGETTSDDNGTVTAPAPTFSDIERFPTYYSQLDKIVEMLKRDRAASCLYVDLSRLRRIELEFGVAQHAEVFVTAGMILDDMRGEYLRQSDIVCRTQDDDGYLCILSSARNADGGAVPLDEIAGRVEERLNQALAPEVHDLLREHPRVSVGYARVLNNSMLRAERLIARLIAECRESAALERERAAQQNKMLLQEVILGEELIPLYQPIVHLQSGDIFGFEALTRGPRGTPLESPTTLFSVADEVDLTFELDRACFRSCLRGAIGLEPVHRLFVNLLPLSFYDSSFIETEVSHLLDAAALTPANVVFEITEQLAIENFNSFRRALARYTSMGFGVAIDDVGTRHSNLETVMALRPHLVKVSDVLTRGVARSTVKREMLQSLNRIAEAIDAVVVAEGIETPDDLVVLHDLGVRYGQGFFLSRPGPPFPRLRASVKRAVASLSATIREPIPAPPADYDDEGDFRENTRPGESVQEAVRLMAQGSGRFVVDHTSGQDGGNGHQTITDPLDEFDDETRPRIHDSGAWEPMSASDLSPEDNGSNGTGEVDNRPLIDSLRADRRRERTQTPADGSTDDGPEPSTEQLS
jgi:diguanylate cyclase (GGDEF)-like protein